MDVAIVSWDHAFCNCVSQACTTFTLYRATPSSETIGRSPCRVVDLVLMWLRLEVGVGLVGHRGDMSRGEIEEKSGS